MDVDTMVDMSYDEHQISFSKIYKITDGKIRNWLDE